MMNTSFRNAHDGCRGLFAAVLTMVACTVSSPAWSQALATARLDWQSLTILGPADTAPGLGYTVTLPGSGPAYAGGTDTGGPFQSSPFFGDNAASGATWQAAASSGGGSLSAQAGATGGGASAMARSRLGSPGPDGGQVLFDRPGQYTLQVPVTVSVDLGGGGPRTIAAAQATLFTQYGGGLWATWLGARQSITFLHGVASSAYTLVSGGCDVSGPACSLGSVGTGSMDANAVLASLPTAQAQAPASMWLSFEVLVTAPVGTLSLLSFGGSAEAAVVRLDSVASVPEPASSLLLLLGAGLLSATAAWRRRGGR